jgi:hypothetical protein
VTLRTLLSRLLRGSRDTDPASILEEMIRRDLRFETFRACVNYLDYERVEGDVLEFGVFAGTSLALLAEACRRGWWRDAPRRIVGFDSFTGLGDDNDDHPRWQRGSCVRVHGWHPLLPAGATVTPDTTRRLFEACGLPQPEIQVGEFEATLPRVLGSKYTAAALVHVDCDLYEATRAVLAALEPILQDGAMILFDDWFHYKAHPGKGEARAFREFLASNSQWEAIPYRSYGVFSASFILHRR